MSKSKYTVTALVPVQVDVTTDSLQNAYVKAALWIKEILADNDICITGALQDLNVLLVKPNIDMEKGNE